MNKRSFIGVTLCVLMLSITACAPQVALALPPATAVPATEPAVVVQTASTVAPTLQPVATLAATADSGKPVSFSKDILPILETACVSCHGGEKTSKGLDLKSYASLMTGSQNGAVILAGNATGSKLVSMVQSGKMPKRGTKLTAEEIQLLLDWVNAGATNN
jgi:uncharacterized membrane protein